MLKEHLPKPISLKPINCTDYVVTDLRNPYGIGWDIAQLQELFNNEEVQFISDVSALGTKDRLMWKYATTGVYDVATGYKLAHNLKRQRLGSAGSSSTVEDEKALWLTV